jgi:glycosyltransferase involved in cell wall biosynthesis
MPKLASSSTGRTPGGAPRRRIAILGIKRLPASAGADRVVEALLDNVSPQNHYTVYLLRDAHPKLACTQDRHYVYIPALKGKHLRAASYFLLCCVHYVIKGSYDVAHVHNSDFGLFCPLLKLKRGVHVIGTFHGDPAKRDKWGRGAKVALRISEGMFIRFCDALTSVSVDKQALKRTVRYIPNGVEASTADHGEAGGSLPLGELGLANRDFLMFACGRLDRTKGLHHLLAAYREMPASEPLLVVGDFSHDAKYSKSILAAASEDERVVLYQRLLDKLALVSVLRRCKVFVFPSEVEAMSMMLLEAIAAGATVICSDIPANLAVVGEGYRYSFRSGDPTALRVTLQAALDEANGVHEPQRLRERVASTFRWEEIALRYEKMYEGVSLAV